jgi:hypothetical protein
LGSRPSGEAGRTLWPPSPVGRPCCHAGRPPLVQLESANWKLIPGNSTHAALTAVGAANIVLAGFVYVAFAEDAAERSDIKEKKAQ